MNENCGGYHAEVVLIAAYYPYLTHLCQITGASSFSIVEIGSSCYNNPGLKLLYNELNHCQAIIFKLSPPPLKTHKAQRRRLLKSNGVKN